MEYRAPPCRRSTAPTRRCRPSSTSWRAAGCATRSPARARATRRSSSRSPARTGIECVVGDRRALGGLRRARDGAGPPGGRWPSPAPPAPRRPTCIPAVAEAREARVPLLVLTADRPPELRDVGAGQAIDQLKLYGSRGQVVRGGRATTSPGAPAAVHHRALACRAVAHGARRPARAGAPELPAARAARARARGAGRGRLGGAPGRRAVDARSARRSTALDARRRATWPARIAVRRRGVIVCGEARRAAWPSPWPRLAAALGWPVLADPLSGLALRPARPLARGGALRRAAARRRLRPRRTVPDLVLRVGDTPTSQAAPRRGSRRSPPDRARPARRAGTSPRARPRRSAWPPPGPLAPLADALGARPPSAGSRLARRPGGAADALVPAALAAAPEPSSRRRGAARSSRCAPGRRARVGQLLDADPRRRGVLPAERPSRSASCPTAARTGSTAWCPRPPAPRWPPAGPASC